MHTILGHVLHCFRLDLANKSKIFTMSFSFNSTLNNKGIPYLTFPLLQCTKFVTSLSQHGMFPDSAKALSLQRLLVWIKITVVALKNFRPVLAVLFSCCLKEKFFSSLWRVLAIFSFFQKCRLALITIATSPH